MSAVGIATIEEAIKGALVAAALPYKPTVATYHGEFDDRLDQVVRSFPAFWVVFAGDGPGRPVCTNRRVWRMPATFVVVAGARSVRSESAARKGSASIVGAYRLLADARAALLQKDFGLAIDPLAPGRIRTIINGKTAANAIAAYAMEWYTAYDYILGELAVPEPPLLERVGLNYHLVPDDGAADAHDVVTTRKK